MKKQEMLKIYDDLQTCTHAYRKVIGKTCKRLTAVVIECCQFISLMLFGIFYMYYTVRYTTFIIYKVILVLLKFRVTSDDLEISK